MTICDITKQRWPRQSGNLLMDDYGKKNFEQSYLGQGRRYRALTLRYGYRIVKGMCKSDFQIIFKTSLDWCSFAYFITIPVCQSSIPSFLAELGSLKNFLSMVTHTILQKSPTIVAIFISLRHKLSLWSIQLLAS